MKKVLMLVMMIVVLSIDMFSYTIKNENYNFNETKNSYLGKLIVVYPKEVEAYFTIQDDDTDYPVDFSGESFGVRPGKTTVTFIDKNKEVLDLYDSIYKMASYIDNMNIDDSLSTKNIYYKIIKDTFYEKRTEETKHIKNNVFSLKIEERYNKIEIKRATLFSNESRDSLYKIIIKEENILNTISSIEDSLLILENLIKKETNSSKTIFSEKIKTVSYDRQKVMFLLKDILFLEKAINKNILDFELLKKEWNRRVEEAQIKREKDSLLSKPLIIEGHYIADSGESIFSKEFFIDSTIIEKKCINDKAFGLIIGSNLDYVWNMGFLYHNKYLTSSIVFNMFNWGNDYPYYSLWGTTIGLGINKISLPIKWTLDLTIAMDGVYGPDGRVLVSDGLERSIGYKGTMLYKNMLGNGMTFYISDFEEISMSFSWRFNYLYDDYGSFIIMPSVGFSITLIDSWK